MNVKNIMWTTVFSTAMIIAGVTLLLLSTLPMENKLEGNDLVVKFIIGKKVIDMSDAVFMPLPETAGHDIIRVGGTSVGKKKSGHFMNTKTKTKYILYLTGKGERSYFEIGKDKYIVDGISSDKADAR